MKLTKVIVASLAIPSVVVPFTTLTSCSQGWGNATPFAVGSLDSSPYSGFNGQQYYDIDHKDMVSYLQSSYAVLPGSSYYGYSAPMKFDDSVEGDHGEWVLGNVGWYTSSDGAFVSTAKDKDKKVVTNARNSTLASNIDFVSTIATSINSYLDLALQYQASQLNKDDNIELKDVSIAWGTGNPKLNLQFNHGRKGESSKEQNSQFIEYCLALSNLIGADMVKALFKTSQINFHFATSNFPIPSYNFPIPSYSGPSNGNQYIDSRFYKLIEANDDVTCPDGQYWTSRSKKQTEKDGNNEYNYRTYTYKSVPLIVHFDGLTKTYANPRIKNKFLVNDVYSTNKEILDSVGSQWDNVFPKFADEDAHAGSSKPLYKSFTLTNSKGLNIAQPTANYDERIDWTDLHGNDFVVLIDYVINAYDKEEGVVDVEHPERNKAIISGISNFFPAYFFDLYNDMFKELKHDSTSVYVVDSKAVDTHNKELLGLLKRTSKDGKKAHASDVSEEGKKLLSFLAYMFGTASGNANTLDTSKFLIESEQHIR